MQNSMAIKVWRATFDDRVSACEAFPSEKRPEASFQGVSRPILNRGPDQPRVVLIAAVTRRCTGVIVSSC